MINFFDWFNSNGGKNDKTWLMFGKGPSFSLRNSYDLTKYYTISLNHTIREQKVLLAHMIDYEVVDQCGNSILQNANYAVMPFYPHIKGDFGGTRRLDDLVLENKTLQTLDMQGRLLWYNLSSCKKVHDNSPVVPFGAYSGGCVLSLLATAGAKRVYSLGIDGGATYSKEFEYMKNTTHNNPNKYDVQFKPMAKIMMKTGVKYSPLNIESPIRIYVGTNKEQMLSTKVLEYSILKNASLSTKVIPLCNSNIDIPTPKDPSNRPKTTFSFQRFLIPQLNKYTGKAIYMDSDMQVFKDIRGLWTHPFNESDLLYTNTHDDKSRSEFSVMFLDCSKLKWNINEIVQLLDRGAINYEQLMFKMCIAGDPKPDIDYTWNSIEKYEENKTALIHYTYMKYQPWTSTENKLCYLWVGELIEAVKEKFISIDYIKEHIAKGYVRPSLLSQIENNTPDCSKLSKDILFLDKEFVAPLTNSWTKYQRTI